MAVLSKDGKYVTVEWGDTLSAIARKYGKGTTYQQLAKYNDIPDANRIYVGQKIYLTQQSTSANNTSKAVIKHFGLQTKTTSTVFATWTWSKSNTENYQAKWEYDSGDGVWFIGSNSTVNDKQSIYSAPANAKRVRFMVKPISKTRTVNNKTSSYWTASWSTAKIYSFADNPPEVPAKPTVKIDGLKLVASLDSITQNASIIQFALYKDQNKYKTGKATIKTQSASFEFVIVPGAKYKVQCRACKGNEYSEWSDFSAEVDTIPATPEGFTKCILQGDNHDQVHLEWKACATATGYDIEYADNQSYFDTTDKTQTKTVDNITQFTFVDEFKVDGESTNSGQWFFRIRAKNNVGVSGWSAISSVTTGKVPAAPTTWSSTNSAVLGESVTLYWVHNTEDGSSETKAQIRLFVDGVQQDTITVIKNSADKESGKTSRYILQTTKVVNYKVEIFDGIYVTTNEVIDTAISGGYMVSNVKTDKGDDVYTNGVIYYCTKNVFVYPDGAKIEWDVATMGEELKEGSSYSEWSIRRTIYIYAKPVINLQVSDHLDEELETLTAFPFYVSAITEPKTQAPVGYYISIIANESYETVDLIGNDKVISSGDILFAKYIDTNLDSPTDAKPTLDAELFSAGDVDLENNQTYTIKVMAYMNSGLTAEASHEFAVAWDETLDVCEPNAEILIDEDTYSAYIRPYCEDSDGNLIEGVTLSVYRREFDGAFTEIATGLENTDNTFVTDPHPALDFARYRVVATTVASGAVTYCDVPGFPVGCNAAIIQWDEVWSSFDTAGNETAPSEPTWAGSMIKIPYNIDVTDKTKKDVELVAYIGRKRPVTYYGTQLGETSSWSMVIPKSDKDTLYALRRLSVWMGDVYVREPSGSGYWANISLSIPQKHRDLTIPITIDVTRVEGGI